MFNNIKTFCPVCKELLGYRQKDSLADFYCKECDTTYYWHSHDKKPTNDKNHKKTPLCGCYICGR